VDDYKRDPDIWRRRVTAKLAMQKEYANLLETPSAAKPASREAGDGAGPGTHSAKSKAGAATREGSDGAGPNIHFAKSKAGAATNAATLPGKAVPREEDVEAVLGTSTPPRKQKRKKAVDQDDDDTQVPGKEAVAGKKVKRKKIKSEG
jgi:hypothetical protein